MLPVPMYRTKSRCTDRDLGPPSPPPGRERWRPSSSSTSRWPNEMQTASGERPTRRQLATASGVLAVGLIQSHTQAVAPAGTASQPANAISAGGDNGKKLLPFLSLPILQ